MVDWAQMITNNKQTIRMIEKEDTNNKSNNNIKTRIKVMEIPKAINNNDRQLAKSHKRSSRKI